MVITVFAAYSSRSSACIAASEFSSRLLVASSSTRIDVSSSIARAKQRSCRSPEERFEPFLETCETRRSAGSRARTNADASSSSLFVPKGQRLCATVPWCSTGSCEAAASSRQSSREGPRTRGGVSA